MLAEEKEKDGVNAFQDKQPLPVSSDPLIEAEEKEKMDTEAENKMKD